MIRGGTGARIRASRAMASRQRVADEAAIMTGLIDTFAPGLFAGKAVLVTGGTSGIGLGAALAFRTLGATVTATGATECGMRSARGAAARMLLHCVRASRCAGRSRLREPHREPSRARHCRQRGRRRSGATPEHDIEVFAEVIDDQPHRNHARSARPPGRSWRARAAALSISPRCSPSSAVHASPPTAPRRAASVSSRRASPPLGPPTACGSTPSPRAGSPRR